MASTTNYFWCWSFKILSETTRGMNMLFCRNMSYFTLLKSLFLSIGNLRWPPMQDKLKKLFISETRYLIEPILNMNNRWMVPYKSLQVGNPRWSWGHIFHRTLQETHFTIIPVWNNWNICRQIWLCIGRFFTKYLVLRW